MDQDASGSSDKVGGYPLPVASPGRPTSRKPPRVSLACQRCKRRKQRCDGTHPTCRPCERAGISCIYERPVRPQYPGGKSLYITALEERIAFLESRIPGFAEDHFASVPQPPPLSLAPEPRPTALSPVSASGHSYRDYGDDHSPPTSPMSRTQRSRQQLGSFSEAESSSLVDGVAYLSLRASGTVDTEDPEPFYLGSSSGATIARIVQASIFHSRRGRQAIFGSTESAVTTEKDGPQTPPTAHPCNHSLSAAPPVAFPASEAARMLLDVFFDKLHTHWPVLDRRLYTQVFERQYDQGALSIQQRGVLHLIYAISARFLQLTKRPCSVDPERHLAAAIEHMDFILEQHNLGTVQFLILLALHGQRSPYGAGAWSQVRHAVTLCIELGFHRRRRTTPATNPRPAAASMAGTPLFTAQSSGASAGNTNTAPTHSIRGAELRRRVFWAAYCLDRLTSGVLGRPFAIDDRDIDAELPCSGPEVWDLTARPLDPDDCHRQDPALLWSNVLPFIHIVKLHRINSRIHRCVYRVDRDLPGQDPSAQSKLGDKMAALQRDLDDWRRTVPHPPRARERRPTNGPGNAGATRPPFAGWMYDPESAPHDGRDFFELQYHKSVLLLLTVLLPTQDPSDGRFRQAAQSAARVCAAYKRLEQQRTLSYTMLALHSCFVAGLTLVYCLWRGGRRLFSFEALEATRACSQSLTIFGEKWPGAVKYRDIFDAISGGLLRMMMVQDGGGGAAGAAGHDEEGGSPFRQLDTATMGGGGGGAGVASMNHMVSDAVREAFMEVDEEAPGGWSGWRMFNEMVQSENAGHQATAALAESEWEFDDMAQIFGMESSTAILPDAPPLLFTPPPRPDRTGASLAATSEWDFGGLEGLS